MSAGHSLKTKESEKLEKRQDIAQELRKLWSIAVMVVFIITSALGTVPKNKKKQKKKKKKKKKEEEEEDE